LSLADSCSARGNARKPLEDDLGPRAGEDRPQAERNVRHKDTFEALAREWIDLKR